MNAKLVTMTGVSVAVLSGASVFFNRLQLAGLAVFLASFITVMVFLVKAFIDNRRTRITNANWFATAILTIVVWLPVALVLAPGICLSLWIDDLIEQGVQYAYTKTADKIRVIDEQIEETVKDTVLDQEKIPTSWWWPPDWFRKATREVERTVERKVLKTVQREIVEPAETGVRVVFSILFGVLRASEYLLYLTIGYSAIRSVLFSLSRAALYGRTRISFTMPHS